MSNFKSLFQSMNIGNVTLKNRYAMAPMSVVHDYEEGAFGERAIQYYLERAKGGVGLIFSGGMKVDNTIEPVSMNVPMPNRNPALFAERLRQLTKEMDKYDSKFFAQLSAGFGRALFPTAVVDKRSYVAPSEISNRWEPENLHRELTVDEIHQIVKDFGTAAKIVKAGGAAGVEIHAVHEGYLLDQFTMSFYNHRTDEYGGSLENRMRFAKEIIDEVHAACGEDFPVGIRYSLKSFVKDLQKGILPEERMTVPEKGRDYEEGLIVAKMLEEMGYAEISVDGGNYDSWYWPHPPIFHERGTYLALAEKVKSVVTIPVISAGMLGDPQLALQAVESHVIDMVALGRPSIADSQIVNKIKDGQVDDIRPCQYCHEGCLNPAGHRPSMCTVNARAAREFEMPMDVEKTTSPKNITIIGAGPAGLESARLLAEKGHQVTIYEKSDHIGGLFGYGVIPEFKKEGVQLIKWWGGQLDKLNVKIEFNTEMDANDSRLKEADTIITATGSHDFIPPVPGRDLSNVHTAKELLENGADFVSGDKPVTLIGGGTVGVELAIWLSRHGKPVQIVEMADKILPKGAPLPNLQMMMELLDFYKVERYVSTKLMSIETDHITVEKDGKMVELASSDVILALGYRSESGLYESLSEIYGTDKVKNLGDSDHVRDVLESVNDAYELVETI